MAGQTEPIDLNLSVRSPSVPGSSIAIGSGVDDYARAALTVANNSVNIGVDIVNASDQLIINAINSVGHLFVSPVIDDLNISINAGDLEAVITNFINSQQTIINAQIQTLQARIDAQITSFDATVQPLEADALVLVKKIDSIVTGLDADATAAETAVTAAYDLATTKIDDAVLSYDDAVDNFRDAIVAFDTGQLAFDQVVTAYIAVQSAYDTALTRFDDVEDAYEQAVDSIRSSSTALAAVSVDYRALSGPYGVAKADFVDAADIITAEVERARADRDAFRALVDNIVANINSGAATTALANLQTAITTYLATDNGLAAQEINARANAIWQLAKDRLQRAFDEQLQAGRNAIASRGFAMPNGLVGGVVNTAMLEFSDKSLELAKQQAIEEIDRQRKNAEFAVKLYADTSVQLATLQIDLQKFITGSQLQAAGLIAQAIPIGLEIVKTRIEGARGLLAAADAQKAAVDAELAGAMAQLEGGKGELAAAGGVLAGAEAGIKAVDAKLKGADAQLEGAKARLEGAKGQLAGAEGSLKVGDAKLKGANAMLDRAAGIQKLKEFVLGIKKVYVEAVQSVAGAIATMIQSKATVLNAGTQAMARQGELQISAFQAIASAYGIMYNAIRAIADVEIAKSDVDNKNAIATAEAHNRAGEAIAQMLSHAAQQLAGNASAALSQLSSISHISAQSNKDVT